MRHARTMLSSARVRGDLAQQELRSVATDPQPSLSGFCRLLSGATRRPLGAGQLSPMIPEPGRILPSGGRCRGPAGWAPARTIPANRRCCSRVWAWFTIRHSRILHAS